MKQTYQELATKINAMNNCIDSGNKEWKEKHLEAINDIMASAPSGSGIDCGTGIDLEICTDNKLVLYCDYHHMNENGMYDGWTEHTITVTPSLMFEFDIKIGGKNRNQIKEYLFDVYHGWLYADS